MIEYIAQAEPDGCMVAAVAMATGRTDAEIRALAGPAYDQGINEVIADDLLGELGFAVMRRYRHIPHLKRDRAAWPCAPFAPVHLCLVHATAGPHAVVLLANGHVLDPWTTARTSLDHVDYTHISWIAGVFRVRA